MGGSRISCRGGGGVDLDEITAKLQGMAVFTIAGVVADLWPNNSIIMRHFFKNNSRIMQTYNYLFVSIISFVNMNNMKITPNATMCSSIISLFLLITLFTVQL